jgi:hypothetical protein
LGPLNLERSSNVPLRAPQRTSAEGPASSEKGQEATSYASPEEQTPLPPKCKECSKLANWLSATEIRSPRRNGRRWRMNHRFAFYLMMTLRLPL